MCPDESEQPKLKRDSDQCQSPRTPPVPELDKHVSFASSCSSAMSSCNDIRTSAIFFARVPPTVPYDDLMSLFSKFGCVKDLNLFRKWASAKTSKGCGTVTFSKSEEASAALLGLNGIHSFDGFPGCDGPMVVEWMDPGRLTAPDAAAALKAAKARAAKAAKKDQHKYCNNQPRANSVNFPVLQAMLDELQGMATNSATARHASGPLPMTGFVGLQHGAQLAGSSVCLQKTHSGPLCLPNHGNPHLFDSVEPLNFVPVFEQAQYGATSSGNALCCWPLLGLPSTAGAAAVDADTASAAALAQLYMNNCSQALDGSAAPTSASGLLPPTLDCTIPGLPPPGGFTPCLSPGSLGALLPDAAAWDVQQQPPCNMGLASGLTSNSRGCPTAMFSLLGSPAPDAWMTASCEGLAAAAVNARDDDITSNSCPVLGMSGLQPALNDAVTTNGWSSSCGLDGAAGLPVTDKHSSGLGSCESACTVLPKVFSVLDGSNAFAMSTHGDEAALASASGLLAQPFGFPNPGMPETLLGTCMFQHSSDVNTLFMPIHGPSTTCMLTSIPQVAELSGAEVHAVATPTGLQLRLQGSATQVGAAQSLLTLLKDQRQFLG